MDSYQDILKKRLVERQHANPRYSLRAFARDLGINPSRLSEILNHKQGLSETAAKIICRKLNFSAFETDMFATLVLAADARSKLRRKKAAQRIAEYKGATQKYRAIELDAFAVISDWYHFAILDLMNTKNFRSDNAWIGKRLNISKYQVEVALERLKKLGFVAEKNGILKNTGATLATPTDVPSEAIRNFHLQVLHKAVQALSLQSLEERDFSALTLAVDNKDLPAIKGRIREFRKSIDDFAGTSRNKSQVYCLSVQFFRLTEKDSQ